jgi:hypothetical protein
MAMAAISMSMYKSVVLLPRKKRMSPKTPILSERAHDMILATKYL